jgi:transcriptional regulator with XRE-family HTH domain
MSEPDQGTIPDWDLADRMRKALREAGIGIQEIADYLEVARGTVSTWINGRNAPSRQTLRLWAMRTGVPYEWLKDGAGIRRRGFLPSRPRLTAGPMKIIWELAA